MEIIELNVLKAMAYIHNAGKYDISVVSGIENHLRGTPEVTHIRLRPNGIDCLIIHKDSSIEIFDKVHYKWGSNYIKLIHENLQ